MTLTYWFTGTNIIEHTLMYLFTGTNAWKLALTLKGKVTAIGPAAEPRIPPEVMKAVEH
jgi:hypothetical protein